MAAELRDPVVVGPAQGQRELRVQVVARDQAEAYAARKREPLSVIEKWLAPNLGYEPTR